MTPICSQSEVAASVYRRVTGKRYTWYVPVCHAAEGIHMHLHGAPGYGGKVLPFRLECGRVDELAGPWRMPDADGLLADAGMDVRWTYRSSVTLTDVGGAVLHREAELIPGGHKRYLDVLRAFWERNKRIAKVYCRVDSRTMSRGGWVTRDGGHVDLIRSHVRYLGGSQ